MKKTPNAMVVFVLVVIVTSLASRHVYSAQTQKVSRIGWLSITKERAISGSFMRGLHELGWFEGQNLIIERRFADGKKELLYNLAAELVELKVDLIVAADSAVISAAQAATRTIPIVMTVTGDPVHAGYVASLARPGGNITGLSNMGGPLGGKRLELLREIAPTVSHVGVVGRSGHADWQILGAVSVALGIKLQALPVDHSNAFHDAVKAARIKQVNGLIVIPGFQTNYNRRQIIDFASNHRVPAMYPLTIYVADGGLMSYGPNLGEMQRRAAYYVDRILRGTKPSDLPVEQPTHAEMAVNLKTADAIGLKIPPEVLQRADRVIK